MLKLCYDFDLASWFIKKALIDFVNWEIKSMCCNVEILRPNNFVLLLGWQLHQAIRHLGRISQGRNEERETTNPRTAEENQEKSRERKTR